MHLSFSRDITVASSHSGWVVYMTGVCAISPVQDQCWEILFLVTWRAPQLPLLFAFSMCTLLVVARSLAFEIWRMASASRFALIPRLLPDYRPFLAVVVGSRFLPCEKHWWEVAFCQLLARFMMSFPTPTFIPFKIVYQFGSLFSLRRPVCPAGWERILVSFRSFVPVDVHPFSGFVSSCLLRYI